MQQPTTVRKPEGGFVFISVRQVCRAWVAYQQRLIRIVDLWVWFAAHELVARRCQVKPGQPMHYRAEELSRLVGGTHSMPISLRKLARANLLHWGEQTLTFPDDRSTLDDSTAVKAMLEQITNRHRLIPVPRRLLRYLAGGCHKVMVATILGHLLRCLYYRDAGCRPQGHCKATWIAQVFGVSVRQVKQSRKMLEGIGLVQRSLTPQWVLNRYGQAMTFNLQWEEPRDAHNSPEVELAENRPSAISAVVRAAHIGVSAQPISLSLSDTNPRETNPADDSPVAVSALVREASDRRTPQWVQQPPTNAPSPTLSSPTPAPLTDPLAGLVAPHLASMHIAPQSSTKSPHLAPPDSDTELSTRGKDQKPASGTPSGVLTAMFLAVQSALREGRLAPTEENPIVIRTVSALTLHEPKEVPSPSVSGTVVNKKKEDSSAQALLVAPTLRHILLQDLRDIVRLLQLYAQAVKAGLIGSSEADRLTFVALAQHVLSYRPDNAGGLFIQLLRKRRFDYVTQDDEDSALRRLKRHFHGGPSSILQPVLETILKKTG